jgi:undecaprenyl-diphosphatase
MNDQLLLFINGLAGHSHLLDTIVLFFARDLVFIVFATALFCVGTYIYKKEWQPVVYFFASMAVSFILLQLLSMLNVDHRPFMDHHLTQQLSHAPGKSFPSDHTTVSTAIAAGILIFTKFKKIGVLLLVGAVVIGVSRIYVGVHYPADILGGLFTGLAGGTLVYGVKRLLDAKGKASVAFSKK